MGNQDDNNSLKNLKILYQAQNKIPKLIEDDCIPDQNFDDYYIKLETLLDGNDNNQSLEIENVFNNCNRLKFKKILITGVAGVGKSTLFQYIMYQWGQDKIFKGEFNYVFQVKLKKLLTYSSPIGYPSDDILVQLIKMSIDDQIYELEDKIESLTTIDQKKLDQIKTNIENLIKESLSNEKSDKTLLLLDGYDMICHLNRRTNDDKFIPSLIDKIFQKGLSYSIIMSSRPNAISDRMQDKFDRKIFCIGLDSKKVKAYVNSFFYNQKCLLHNKEHGSNTNFEQSSKKCLKLIYDNPSIMDLIKTPINLLMLCLIISDKDISNFNVDLGQLYQEAVLWLSKRHQKNIMSENEIQNITDKTMFLLSKELSILKNIAYEEFINGNILISGYAINEKAAKYGEIDINKLYKFGMLKPEVKSSQKNKKQKENDNLINMYFSFVHFSFQEYFTAIHIKEQLESEKEIKNAANFIAEHRNEPKYLMTLKFLAGLTTNSNVKESNVEKENQVINSFWEAITCNVDGVLELGIDTKVNLLMHLLTQTIVNNKIPNLTKCLEIIDNTVLQDITKWSASIMSSKYISDKIASEIKLIFANVQEVDEELLVKIKSCAEIGIHFLDEKQIWNDKKEAIEHYMNFVLSKNKKVKMLGIDSVLKIIDNSMKGEERNQCINKILPGLLDHEMLSDPEIGYQVLNLFFRITEDAPDFAEQVLSFIKSYFANTAIYVKTFITILHNILKANQRLQNEVLDLIIVLGSKLEDEFMIKNLVKVAQVAPDLSYKLFEYLAGLNFIDNFNLFRGVIEIIKVNPELADKVPALLIQHLSSKEIFVGCRVVEYFTLLVNNTPQLTGKVFQTLSSICINNTEKRYLANEVLKELSKTVPVQYAETVINLLIPLCTDSSLESSVRVHAVRVLEKLSKVVPQYKKKLLKQLTMLCYNDSNVSVRNCAETVIKELIKASPEFADKVKKHITTVCSDSEALVTSNASSIFGYVTIVAHCFAGDVPKILEPLCSDSDVSVRADAVKNLKIVVKAAPILAGNVLKLLTPLCSNSDTSVVANAFNTLKELAIVAANFKYEELKQLTALCFDSRVYIGLRVSAIENLKTFSKVDLKFEYNVLKLLNLYCFSLQASVRKNAVKYQQKIIKANHAFLSSVLKPLIPLCSDSENVLKTSAVKVFKELIEPIAWYADNVIQLFTLHSSDSEASFMTNAFIALRDVAIVTAQFIGDVLKISNQFFSNLETTVGDHAVEKLKKITIPASQFLDNLRILLTSYFYDLDATARINAVKDLRKIINVVPQFADDGLIKLIKSLCFDSEDVVKIEVAKTLKVIADVNAEPIIQKGVFDLLPSLFLSSNYLVKEYAAKCLAVVVNTDPDLATDAFKLVKTYFYDVNKLIESNYVIGDVAVDILNRILNAKSNLAEDALKLLDDLCNSPQKIVMSSIYEGLLNILKNDPSLAEKIFNLVIKLCSSDNINALLNVYEIIKYITQANNTLSCRALELLISFFSRKDNILSFKATINFNQIASADQQLSKDALELLFNYLPSDDDDIRQVRMDTAKSLINSMDLYNVTNLLLSNINTIVNELAEKAALVKLKAKVVTKSDYKELESLIRISQINKELKTAVEDFIKKLLDPQDIQDFNKLSNGEEISGWINNNFRIFERLQSSILKSFLTKLLHLILNDYNISEQDSLFIVNCIKIGITPSVTRDGSLVLEDTRYSNFTGSSNAYLKNIVTQVFSQSNVLQEQYKTYSPIFENSGLWLKKAASDFSNITSLVSSADVLSNQKVIMSYLKTKNNEFYLLELRNEFGDLVVYKINNDAMVSMKTVHPDDVSTLRKNLFGKLKNIKYYITTIKISYDQLDLILKSINSQQFSNQVGVDTFGGAANTQCRQSLSCSDLFAKIPNINDSKKQKKVPHWKLLGLNKNLLKVMFIEQSNQVQIDLKKYNTALEEAGVYDEGKILRAIESLANESSDLATYYKTFYWTLTNYFQAFRVAETGLVKKDIDFCHSNIKKYTTKSVMFALKAGEAIPVAGTYIEILNTIVESVYNTVYEHKLKNKETAINKIIKSKLNSEQDLGKTIQKTAIGLIELKKLEILDPVFTKEESKIAKVVSFCEDKFTLFKSKLIEENVVSYDKEGGQAAEIAMRDIIVLLTYLYKNYQSIVTDEKPLNEQLLNIFQDENLELQPLPEDMKGTTIGNKCACLLL